MKKSRIIVPAMAMIAFTSLASIAGSVAWFTASRQVTIAAGSYAVVKTTSNLECALSNGVGTTTDSPTKTVTFGGKLTDGSFNHSTAKIYTPNDEGTGLAAAPKNEIGLNDAELATKLVRATTSDSKTVYTAVTWKVAFTVNFGATAGDYGLFLNTKDAPASAFTVDGGGDAITAKGFRIALVPDVWTQENNPTNSSRYPIVFADLQTSANCHYISGIEDADTEAEFKAGTNYTSSDRLVHSGYAESMPAADANRDETIARADCLGVFGYQPSTKVTLNYIAVAWFEGTDPEIKNRDLATDYQTVVASLTFEAAKLAAASGSSSSSSTSEP